MEPSYTFTKSQIALIFEHWNKQAAEGEWPARDDPEASAEHFIKVATDLEHESQMADERGG